MFSIKDSNRCYINIRKKNFLNKSSFYVKILKRKLFSNQSLIVISLYYNKSMLLLYNYNKFLILYYNKYFLYKIFKLSCLKSFMFKFNNIS